MALTLTYVETFHILPHSCHCCLLVITSTVQQYDRLLQLQLSRSLLKKLCIFHWLPSGAMRSRAVAKLWSCVLLPAIGCQEYKMQLTAYLHADTRRTTCTFSICSLCHSRQFSPTHLKQLIYAYPQEQMKLGKQKTKTTDSVSPQQCE